MKSSKNQMRKNGKVANQVQDFANKNNPVLQKIQASGRNCTIIQEGKDYVFIDKDLDIPIGMFTQRSDSYIEIALYRDGTNTQHRGKEIFAALLENHKQRGISFKGFMGTWSGGDSDNRKSFNDFVLSGLSKEEAALKVWTGERVKDLGFTKVTMVKLEPDKPPYTSVVVRFDK